MPDDKRPDGAPPSAARRRERDRRERRAFERNIPPVPREKRAEEAPVVAFPSRGDRRKK